MLRSRWDGGGGLEGHGARPEDAGWRPRDGLLLQELVAGQAAVPRPTLRIEDPERGPPVRRPVVVLRDADFRPLSNDLATQPNPAGPAELQAQAGALVERGPQRRRDPRWLKDEKERAGPSGECDQPGQLASEIGRTRAAPVRGRRRCRRGRHRHDRRWGRRRPPPPGFPKVQHKDVHRARLEQRASHRERLGRIVRDEHGEPFQADTASHCLHGIEGAREVDPGGERAPGLRLGESTERECGRAAGARSRQRNGAGPR